MCTPVSSGDPPEEQGWLCQVEDRAATDCDDMTAGDIINRAMIDADDPRRVKAFACKVAPDLPE